MDIPREYRAVQLPHRGSGCIEAKTLEQRSNEWLDEFAL